MKPFLLCLLCISCVFASAQKLSLIPRLGVTTAAGEQRGKLRNAYSLGGGMELAFTDGSPLKFVAMADAGLNGSQLVPFTLRFLNTTTRTSIQYNSWLVQVGSGFRYVADEGGVLSPYAGVAVGMLLYSTSYTINDPEDNDGCRALETRNIHRDVALTGRVEAGARFRTKWEVEQGRPISIDIGASYLRGTRAEFIRLGEGAATGSSTDYTAKFETPTAEVHEHSIGRLYNTGVNQLMFHVGVHLPISGSRKKR